MRNFLLYTQNILIGLSLALLVYLPIWTVLFGSQLSFLTLLYLVSFTAVFLVMIIRPLGDILGWAWLRQCIVLRKGLGILSASIIVGLAIGRAIVAPGAYFGTMFSMQFFSWQRYAVWAHLGDVTGFILLITSNVFSQRLLRANWKRVQRLAYVYFFSGGIYEAFGLGNRWAGVAMVIVIILTVAAWGIKRLRRWREASSAPVAVPTGEVSEVSVPDQA